MLPMRYLLTENPRKKGARYGTTRTPTPFIEGWITAQPSDDEAVRILQEGHVPTAPVLSIAEAVNHPHLRARGTVRQITDRTFGTLDIPGMPLRFSQFPDELPLQAPFLGEHNEEILTTHLSYTAEQVRELQNEGVLKQDLTK